MKTQIVWLSNSQGVRVGLNEFGARIVFLYVPDRSGEPNDIVLGAEAGALNSRSTETANFYFGVTVGRYANRIRGGRFVLGDQTYHLPQNEGNNTLHGGSRGFDQHIWQSQSVPAGVCFTRQSPAGEQGFPGNLDVKVTYSLNAENELKIRYEAVTDHPTVVNLTHHSYFNLKGAGNGDILDHRLKIIADKYTPTDRERLPTGVIASVEGTPIDFRKSRSIGEALSPPDYDHNYVLEHARRNSLDLAAEVFEASTGRRMQVFTDQPGLQFYSGRFLNESVLGKGRQYYGPFSGFCLETQNFPDAPNQSHFPSAVLLPGDVYRTETIYKFAIGQEGDL